MTLRPPNNNNIPGANQSILMRIRSGMEVYGANGDHIGKVDLLYMGAASPVENKMGTGAATATGTELRGDTFLESIAEALSVDDIPEVLRARLRQEGFIRVDAAGLFSRDRFVLPEQIAGVNGDRVTLKVNKDDLLKH